MPTVEELTQQLQERDEAFGQLKEAHAAELEQSNTALSEATQKLEALQNVDATNEALSGSLATAVESYKAALAKANPSIPQELLAGDTIEAVDSALESATALVDKIKAALAAEAKVLPGAPTRSGPNLEGLTGEAKIKVALTTQPK